MQILAKISQKLMQLAIESCHRLTSSEFLSGKELRTLEKFNQRFTEQRKTPAHDLLAHAMDSDGGISLDQLQFLRDDWNHFLK